MKMYKNRRKRKWWLGILISLCVVCGILAGWAGLTWDGPGSMGASQSREDRPWNLILVNKDYSIPEDYSVTLLELSNGKRWMSGSIQSFRKCLTRPGPRGFIR